MSRDEVRTRLALCERRVSVLRQLGALRHEIDSLRSVDASLAAELDAIDARLEHAPELDEAAT